MAEPGTGGGSARQNVRVEAGFGYGVIGADLHVWGDGSPLYLLTAYRQAPPVGAAWLRAAPSRMLHAHAEVVPFTGRAAERADLAGWRNTATRLAVRWLHAPGGYGKTRLAHEVARQADAGGWRVAVATLGVGAVQPPPGSQDLTPDGCAGVLMVVDYADRWPLRTLIWLLRNALLHRPELPARVLLLARGTVGWPALRGVLEQPGIAADTSVRRLAELPGDGQRATMFAAARDSFATVYDIADPHAVTTPVSLDAEQLGSTLALHMAALVAVDAYAHGWCPPAEPSRLTRYLIDREEGHWGQLYEDGLVLGLDYATPPSVLSRTTFTAALTGPVPHARAHALLDHIESELPAERILTDHARCYPPAQPHDTGVLQPLYPDLLGEDFVARLLPGDDTDRAAQTWAPNRVQQLIDVLDHTSASMGRVMTVLTAAASRWQHVGPNHLFPLLREQPHLALAGGPATIATLAELSDADPAVLEAIDALLPDDRDINLDPARAALSSALIERRLADARTDAHRAERQATHAWWLANAGRLEEAIAPAQDAAGIHRRLARTDPVNHRPPLAGVLNNLATFLGRLDRPKEAQQWAAKSVKEHRWLVDATPPGPARRLPTELLVAALTNHASALTACGRRPEALEKAREAVSLGRQLRDTDPTAHPTYLAGALLTLGSLLSGSGDRDEALDTTRESVDLARDLALEQPARHLPDLFTSLINYAATLNELGRHAQAVAVAEEAVGLTRSAAVANPAFLPDHATALNGLTAALCALDQYADALEPAREAVALRERLAAGRRTTELVVDLAATLSRYEHIRHRLDNAATPSGDLLCSGNDHPDLAALLINIGISHAKDDKPAEAVGPGYAAVGVYRRLCDRNPQQYGPALTVALYNLAAFLVESERPVDALAPAGDAVTRLGELDTANAPKHGWICVYALDVYARACAGTDRDLQDAVDATQAALILSQELSRRPDDYTATVYSLCHRLANLYERVGRHLDAGHLRNQLDNLTPHPHSTRPVPARQHRGRKKRHNRRRR